MTACWAFVDLAKIIRTSRDTKRARPRTRNNGFRDRSNGICGGEASPIFGATGSHLHIIVITAP